MSLNETLEAKENVKRFLDSLSPIEVAKMFHGTYERLAPDFGYVTGESTRELNLESPNGKLMVATCKEIINLLRWSVTGGI